MEEEYSTGIYKAHTALFEVVSASFDWGDLDNWGFGACDVEY